MAILLGQLMTNYHIFFVVIPDAERDMIPNLVIGEAIRCSEMIN